VACPLAGRSPVALPRLADRLVGRLSTERLDSRFEWMKKQPLNA